MRKLQTEKPHQPICAKETDLFDVTQEFLTSPLNTDQLVLDLEEAKRNHAFTAKAFGGWDSIPLRSLAGVTGLAGSRASGQHASSDAALFKDTIIMPSYIRSVLDEISAQSGGVLKVRLMRLQAGRKIGEHRDHFTPGPRVARLHIPIVTNPQVFFHVNRQPYHLEAGRVYCMDVSQLHAVDNGGSEDRVHLVFDLVITPAIDKKLHVAALKREK